MHLVGIGATGIWNPYNAMSFTLSQRILAPDCQTMFHRPSMDFTIRLDPHFIWFTEAGVRMHPTCLRIC
jgi:hypothetical protein